MTTFQMDLADRWLVVPLDDDDAVAHWLADLGRIQVIYDRRFYPA